MLDEILAEIEERLQEKNISVVKNYHADFEYSPSNKTLLFTMYFNIINNEVEYIQGEQTFYNKPVSPALKKLVEIIGRCRQ